MDPVSNLESQRQLAARLVRQLDAGKPVSPDEVSVLAELVLALDEWRTRGGFDPYVSAPMPPASSHASVSYLQQIRREWPLSTLGTDDEINGGDVVEWLAELAEGIDGALSAHDSAPSLSAGQKAEYAERASNILDNSLGSDEWQTDEAGAELFEAAGGAWVRAWVWVGDE